GCGRAFGYTVCRKASFSVFSSPGLTGSVCKRKKDLGLSGRGCLIWKYILASGKKPRRKYMFSFGSLLFYPFVFLRKSQRKTGSFLSAFLWLSCSFYPGIYFFSGLWAG